MSDFEISLKSRRITCSWVPFILPPPPPPPPRRPIILSFLTNTRAFRDLHIALRLSLYCFFFRLVLIFVNQVYLQCKFFAMFQPKQTYLLIRIQFKGFFLEHKFGSIFFTGDLFLFFSKDLDWSRVFFGLRWTCGRIVVVVDFRSHDILNHMFGWPSTRPMSTFYFIMDFFSIYNNVPNDTKNAIINRHSFFLFSRSLITANGGNNVFIVFSCAKPLLLFYHTPPPNQRKWDVLSSRVNNEDDVEKPRQEALRKGAKIESRTIVKGLLYYLCNF